MVEYPGSPATLRTATWLIRWLFVAVGKFMLTYMFTFLILCVPCLVSGQFSE